MIDLQRIDVLKTPSDKGNDNYFLFTIHYVHYLYFGLPTGEQQFFVFENAVPRRGKFADIAVKLSPAGETLLAFRRNIPLLGKPCRNVRETIPDRGKLP